MKVLTYFYLFIRIFSSIDITDDKSQTVSTVSKIEHSRTPSPQKPLSNSHLNTPTSLIATSTSSTILRSSTTPPNIQSPVYTFLPYTPPSSSSNPTFDTTTNIPVHQTSTQSVNIYAPKPFRSTASINLDAHHTNETVRFSLPK
jgi:hypothetical protein